VLKDCRNRKCKILSAAGILNKEFSSEIITAAQSIVQKAITSPMKGLGTMLVLDSVKEHLLMTIKVNKYIAKTLVDPQTTAADLISSTFYILYKIPLYKMNLSIIL